MMLNVGWKVFSLAAVVRSVVRSKRVSVCNRERVCCRMEHVSHFGCFVVCAVLVFVFAFRGCLFLFFFLILNSMYFIIIRLLY